TTVAVPFNSVWGLGALLSCIMSTKPGYVEPPLQYRPLVGACIVNQEKKIVSIGYNSMPNGCDDDLLPWTRFKDGIDWLESKTPYVCHAELNAIMNKKCADVKGCTIYVTLFPCNECAKLIIQAGIREVIFLSDMYHDRRETVASRTLLSMAGIKCNEKRIVRTLRTSQRPDVKTCMCVNNSSFYCAW
uniref:Deoxycytidylate deaminase n=1 Tax=Sparus aurata TaxID=8175 RepID=A0A671VX37_SPAAU